VLSSHSRLMFALMVNPRKLSGARGESGSFLFP
jgi:hypothetical protein